MKKLLSLLSTITIAGSGMLGIIGNNPYPIQEKEVKNNLKTLNRNKREINVKLKNQFPSIKQKEITYCSQAVAEAILIYLGLPFSLIQNNEILDIDNSIQNYQDFLRISMGLSLTTDGNELTDSYELMNALNLLISRNLDIAIEYSETYLSKNYNDYNKFYNLVQNSLKNNAPVILLYKGNLPNRQGRGLGHAIVITEVNGVGENAIYTYMNPRDGNFGTFRANDLGNMTGGGGMIINYINPAQATALNLSIEEKNLWIVQMTHNLQLIFHKLLLVG